MKALLCGLILMFTIHATVKGDVWDISRGVNLREYLDLNLTVVRGGKNLSAEEDRKLNMGLGYIRAFVDFVYVSEGYGVQHPFTLPEGFSPQQFTLVLDKYTKEHPEKLHLTSMVTIITALSEAFPNPAFKGKKP